MKIVVVYGSRFGHAASIGEAIAEGARTAGADVVAGSPGTVSLRALQGADLVVIGAPTHGSGIPEAGVLERFAPDQRALGSWIDDLDLSAEVAAAFDTRWANHMWLTGSAAKWIERRLTRNGFRIGSRQSFFVEYPGGPLAKGELSRARAWGRMLVQRFVARDTDIPVRSLPASVDRSRRAVGTRGSVETEPRRALIVDPSADRRERAATCLEAFGYDILQCPGPSEPSECIGIRSGRCPLADGSDLVVLGIQHTSEQGSAGARVLDVYLAGQRGVIVIADDDDSAHARHDPRILTVRSEAARLELVSAIGRFKSRNVS